MDKAIADMPEDYVIREFLNERQSEVKSMCLTEYDEAEAMRMFKEEGREEGYEEGRTEERDRSVRLFILDKNEDAVPEGKIVEKLQRLYGMSGQDALAYV